MAAPDKQALTKMAAIIAVGMVLFGSANSLLGKWANIVWAYGQDHVYHQFTHPLMQTLFMFIGELFCIFVYKYLAFKGKMQKEINEMSPDFTPWLFALPAFLDMCGSSMMYIGLAMTDVSVYQMLRGFVMICTGIFSVIFLKRKLLLHHWVGMGLLVGGLIIVGLASILYPGSHGTAPNPILGDILVVTAQIVAATQMVVEEKFLGKYNVPALLAVGWEGIFGFAMMFVLMFPCYFIVFPKSVDWSIDNRFENAVDCLIQMGHSVCASFAMVLSAFAVMGFNYCGVSITKLVSATTRMVVDSIRTFVVWIFGMLVFHEEFHDLQVIGFLLLLAGTFVYNEVIIVPALMPAPAPASDPANSPGADKEKPLLQLPVSAVGGDEAQPERERDPLLKSSPQVSVQTQQ